MESFLPKGSTNEIHVEMLMIGKFPEFNFNVDSFLEIRLLANDFLSREKNRCILECVIGSRRIWTSIILRMSCFFSVMSLAAYLFDICLIYLRINMNFSIYIIIVTIYYNNAVYNIRANKDLLLRKI